MEILVMRPFSDSYHQNKRTPNIRESPTVHGVLSFASFPCTWPTEIASGLGWPIVGPRALRIDILAKVEGFLAQTPKRVPVPNHPTQWLGCSVEDWHAVLKAMGYRIHNGLLLSPKKRRR